MAQPIEAVLLDAGGVLLDLDYELLRRLIAQHGSQVETIDLARAEARARAAIEALVRAGGRVGQAWREYFRIVLREVRVPAAVHETVIDALWEAHQRAGLWTVAIAGARSAVAELKRAGFRLAVVSNAEGRVAQDLDRAGYTGLFETVVDSFHVGVEKPDPAIFRVALDHLRVRPEHALFLGDLPAVDVAGALAAGIAPLLLDPHDLYPDLDAPRLRSISELPAYLRQAHPRG
jgi:putative hydrolase of the HAD superfamily